MRRIILGLLGIMTSVVSLAQVSGNINYQHSTQYSERNIEAGVPQSDNIYITVKGLANVKANAYVAIFSLTQVGETTDEVNRMMDERISQSLSEINQKQGVQTYVDMVSFVPIYEFEIEKKLFSKTYNEIPKGFELKKNIHIQYSDPNQLNEIIRILSKHEIYDLVRVDYFSDQIASVKKQLMTQAKSVLQEKIKSYETLLGTTFANETKRINEASKVQYPIEMYKSFEAFNSSSLHLKKSANINRAEKSATLYYQPIMDKEFDFVINPVILEPVIQVMYEVILVIDRDKKSETKASNYFLITPNGDIKSLDMR